MLTCWQTERGTALGWFLAGSMSGYALGPVVGGAIITYTSWRVIFWVQAGLSGAAVPTTYFLLRETIHSTRTAELTGQGIRRAARQTWQWMNPAITVKVFADPNMFFVVRCLYAADVFPFVSFFHLTSEQRFWLHPHLYGICTRL